MGDAITYAEMNFSNKRQSCAPQGKLKTEDGNVTYASLNNAAQKKPKTPKSQKGKLKTEDGNVTYASLNNAAQKKPKTSKSQKGNVKTEDGNVTYASLNNAAQKKLKTSKSQKRKIAGGKLLPLLLPAFSAVCLILLSVVITLSITCKSGGGDRTPRQESSPTQAPDVARRESAKYRQANNGSGQTYPRCPPLWIGINNKCYFLSEEKKNLKDSQQYCKGQNFTLATIREETIRRLLRVTKQEFWIGLIGHTLPEGKWIGKWTDGSNETLQVTEGAGSCVKLGRNLTTENCYNELLFICERDAA